MAAASMSMSVASTRFAAVVARAESAQARSSSVVSMGVAAASPAMSCVFAEFPKRTSGMNAAIVARAAEIFDLATEEAGEGGEQEEAAPSAPAVQQGSKLYVGNLPWTCNSSQLAEICQDFGTVEAVEVIYDQESGRSRGFAFVTMASHEDAAAVIAGLDGSDLGGRPLRVNYPQAKGDRPRFDRSERPERREGGGQRGFPRREDSPNKLFVGNLSWSCDEAALHQVFSDYGRVVDAKVVTDRDTGRSRGFGFVTLETEGEARSAIENLNGTDFDGRPLRVNLSSDKPPPRF